MFEKYIESISEHGLLFKHPKWISRINFDDNSLICSKWGMVCGKGVEMMPIIYESIGSKTKKEKKETMDPLPSDPRQPPDGHEFPDFDESFQRRANNPLQHTFRLNYPPRNQDITPNINQTSSFEIRSSDSSALKNTNSMSNTDLSAISRDEDYHETDDIANEGAAALLHTRSQSLCELSYDKRQTEQWHNLVEQRRKSLSKLKGLVIPDSISESDCSSTINLPEIKSNASVPIETFNSLESSEASNEASQPSSVDSSRIPLSPPWTGAVDFPKYSPAFKRKDLQLYSTLPRDETEKSGMKIFKPSRMKKSSVHNESSSGDDSSVPMKSVDSSPTRSESGFEYVTPRNKPKQRTRPLRYTIETSFLNDYHKNKKEINTEDESDNDSAVSSSQSSFISRPTASPSPTRSIEFDNVAFKSSNTDYRFPEARHLKPASVEAINRKNILASAKCRSGKDLKVGSPVINRKLDEPDEKIQDTLGKKVTACCEKDETVLKTVQEEYSTPKSDEMKIEKDTPKVIETPKPFTRRISADSISALPPKPTTALLKSKFETLSVPKKPQRTSFTRSLSKDSAPISTDVLKSIPPMVTKREEKMSRFASAKSLSVTDLRKNFEEIAKTAPVPVPAPVISSLPAKKPPNVASKVRNTEPLVAPEVKPGTPTGNRKVPEAKPRSSLEAKKILEAEAPPLRSRQVILKPDVVGTSLGITLAGGIDENKEISVHRIRFGSVAYEEGSLAKGDHIISINGIETKGLSHLEAVDLLKMRAKSFVINVAVKDLTKDDRNMGNKAEAVKSSQNSKSGNSGETVSGKKANHEIILQKDGNGLGFSVEGGKDSPQGDVPLLVKKIFQGGVADKDGRLKVGDEILAINNIDFTTLSRIQAWTLMKKLEIGSVKIQLFR